MKRRHFLTSSLGAGAVLAAPGLAGAQSAEPLRLGLLTA